MRTGWVATLLGLLGAVSIALGADASSAPPPIVPPPGVQMRRVGDPVQVLHTPAACVGDGHVYEVTIGTPPRLLELRPDGTLVASVPLDHGYNAWAVAQGIDGTVYTAVTSNNAARLGYLYAWRPGAAAAEVVATIPNTVTVWSLAVDPVTGLLWIGAQGLYAYNPASGQLQDYGMLGQSEHDVHAVAAYGGTVWAGLTPYTELVHFDPATGDREVTQNPATSGVSRLDALDASTVAVLWRSGVLQVERQEGSGITTVGELSAAASDVVALGGQDYAFLLDGAVAEGLDGVGGHTEHPYPTGLGVLAAEPVSAVGALDGEVLAVLDNGDILAADPASWQFNLHPVVFAGSPGIIHDIAPDTDGSLWASVYLGGEVTHVVNGRFTFDPFPPQADGMAAYNGTLYIGGYPGGWLYAYDESRPWDALAGNPQALGRVQLAASPQQDRTYAIAAGPQGVYLGTIPAPGYLEGNLGDYDPATHRLQVFDTPVPDEAITSLAYASDGMLVGTTTAYGGGAVAPTQGSGYLFVWNPTTQSVVESITPEAGMPEWGGLVALPNGEVYGANPRAVFRFDPATGQRAVRVFAPSAGYDEWSSLTHMTTWNGRLYLLSMGHLYAVDPTTLKTSLLFYGAEQMAVSGGYLYVSYHDSVVLERLPLSLLTPKNSVYPMGYITKMQEHPAEIP